VINIDEPCDFNPFKPLNKSTITIVYKTFKLTKHIVANAKRRKFNLGDYKTPK
jgi:hypothetical protein